MGKTAEHGFPRWYKIGAVETRDPSLLRCLSNSQIQVTSERYDTLESPEGTDYQVPTGKTLYITKLQVGSGATSGTFFILDVGYGDDGVANSASAPTNRKVVYRTIYMQGAGLRGDLDVFIPIPAGKYPYIYGNGSWWNIAAMGIEV